MNYPTHTHDMEPLSLLEMSHAFQHFPDRLRVGVEVELAILDAETGKSVGYTERGGGRDILHAVVERGCGKPHYEGNNLLAVELDDGQKLSLEYGGAIEISSAPSDQICKVADQVHTTMARLAEIAETYGKALYAGAYMPFQRLEEMEPIPHVRSGVMWDYFSSLGEAGEGSRRIMMMTLSTQTSVDYESTDDLCEKLTVLSPLMPVAVALFLNSPLESGSPCGVLSRRLESYLCADPVRNGAIAPAFDDLMSLEDLIRWIANIPMIYRLDGNGFKKVERTFLTLLDSTGGFAPTIDDWQMHCSQVYTDIRVRRTLELRAVDGPPFPHFMCAPTFWRGIIYTPEALQEAKQLIGKRTLREYRLALEDVLVNGLSARYGKDSMGELATELVRLARQGTAAQIACGTESEKALALLTPLEEIAYEGKTFAERMLEDWEGPLRRSPERFVQQYKIGPLK